MRFWACDRDQRVVPTRVTHGTAEAVVEPESPASAQPRLPQRRPSTIRARTRLAATGGMKSISARAIVELEVVSMTKCRRRYCRLTRASSYGRPRAASDRCRGRPESLARHAPIEPGQAQPIDRAPRGKLSAASAGRRHRNPQKKRKKNVPHGSKCPYGSDSEAASGTVLQHAFLVLHTSVSAVPSNSHQIQRRCWISSNDPRANREQNRPGDMPPLIAAFFRRPQWLGRHFWAQRPARRGKSRATSRRKRASVGSLLFGLDRALRRQSHPHALNFSLLRRLPSSTSSRKRA